MYKAQQARPAASRRRKPAGKRGSAGSAGGGNDKVVDADFEEVDDKKRRLGLSYSSHGSGDTAPVRRGGLLSGVGSGVRGSG